MGSDETERRRPTSEQGVDALRADLERPGAEASRPSRRSSSGKIPQTRIGRSAKLGTAIGGQATRYAGTAAANVVRSDEKAQERLETRHLETALKMASVLGRDEGRRDEDRPDGLLHRRRLPAARVPRDLPGAARQAPHPALPRCPGRRSARCSTRSTTSAPSGVFAADRGGGLRGRLDRAGPPRDPARRHARSRSRSSTRGSPRRSSPTSPTPASSCGWRRCWRPGLDAKAVAVRAARARPRGARLRVRGAEPARLRPRLRRATRSSSSPRSTRGSRGGGCWSATTSRAAASTR